MTAPRKISSHVPQLWIGALVFATSVFPACAVASVRILVDQVGYEPQAIKVALVAGTKGDPAPSNFALINIDSGKTVLEGPLHTAGDVYDWHGM